MNLHDLDQPRMASAEFFTPEMLQRVGDNYGTFRADVHVPEGAVINNITLHAIGNVEDVVREIRQERDGYWTYTTRVTNLDLPHRIEGVFLDTETP